MVSGALTFLVVKSSLNPSDCRAFSNIFSSNSARSSFWAWILVVSTGSFRRRDRGAVRDRTYMPSRLRAHKQRTYSRTFILVANVVLNPELVIFFFATLRFRLFRGGLLVFVSLFYMHDKFSQLS